MCTYIHAVNMSSIVTEVLANVDSLEKLDLDAKLSVLSKKMTELKVEVYDSLEKKYVVFYPNLRTAVDLMERVRELSSQMETVANKVEKETQLRLTMSAKEFQSLSMQLSEATAVLQVLARLVETEKALQDYAESLESGRYQQAVASLNRVHKLVSDASGPEDAKLKILQALRNKYCFEKARLTSDITKAWLDTVRWELHNTGEEASCGPKFRVALGIKYTESQAGAVKQLVQAMHGLDILYPKIKNFADTFLKYVVEPILTSKDVEVTVKTSESGKSLLLSGSRMEKRESASPISCLNDISEAVQFLHGLFSTEISEPAVEEGQEDPNSTTLMAILRSFVDKQLIELIITKCLTNSIPTSSKDLEDYSEVIAKTESFQNQLKEFGLLSEDDNALADFVNNVDALFANKKCQQLLERARKLMTTEIHNMVSVGPVSSDDLPPLGLEGTSAKHSKLEGVTFAAGRQLSYKTFHLPVCCVSQSVKQLIDLAYETLHEALSTQNSAQCRIQLFYTTRNMFVLFSDVVPTYHRQSLDDLPQITALHHNDCMYIAHHLLTLGHQFRQGLPSPLDQGAATFIDLVPKLRRQGTGVFLRQMSKQRDLILDYLNTAEGFANVSEENNQNKALKAIRQVLHQLQHLSNVWKDVLPENVYCTSIGTLLNTAIVEIMSKVTSLEDISADDASELHALMSLIADKAATFFEIETHDNKPQDAKKLLHAKVNKWNKFIEVMWVLNAGLHDIGDRWADGKGPLAAELEAAEVKQLIRALFQNTEKRSKVLASIK